ncbi:MAG: hypothetical protein ACXV7G_12115 [Halobacteriota archaeon]
MSTNNIYKPINHESTLSEANRTRPHLLDYERLLRARQRDLQQLPGVFIAYSYRIQRGSEGAKL